MQLIEIRFIYFILFVAAAEFILNIHQPCILMGGCVGLRQPAEADSTTFHLRITVFRFSSSVLAIIHLVVLRLIRLIDRLD
jgi:hypothetical protein